jgi:hypothetical protein
MIAPVKCEESVPKWHAGFLAMMPVITKIATHAFRDRDPEAKEDLTEEVVVNAMVAYKRLFDKGRVDDAHPRALARYAIAQVCEGRKGGSKHSCREVLSEYAQKVKGFHVDRLDYPDEEDGTWRQVIVEDRRAGPAEIAATRIDFHEWFHALSKQQKKGATRLASGESTGEVARIMKVSSGRISQIRRELFESWKQFQGEGLLNRTLEDAVE